MKFLRHEDESHSVFPILCFKVQNEKDLKILNAKSGHGGKFENKYFEKIFDANDISHDFSYSRTPQQNEVLERKNRTLQEMFRTMIKEICW